MMLGTKFMEAYEMEGQQTGLNRKIILVLHLWMKISEMRIRQFDIYQR